MTIDEAIRWFEESVVGCHVTGDRELIEVCTLAISALRAQQQSQTNDPLTMEELREMDGEPVYCVNKKFPKRSAWGILRMRDELPHVRTFPYDVGISAFYYFSTLGIDWLAYRHKPEEE